MNKGWRNLVIIGVIALLFTIGWELYQAQEGGREEFNPFVNVLDRALLFPPKLEEHIKNGSANVIDKDAEVEDDNVGGEVIIESDEIVEDEIIEE
jgi:hypothetical protein